MSQQPQTRPWFRLASMARPSTAPPPPPAPAPTPVPRPAFIRPTFTQTFAPLTQPAQPPPPPPPPPPAPIPPQEAPIPKPPSPPLPSAQPPATPQTPPFTAKPSNPSPKPSPPSPTSLPATPSPPPRAATRPSIPSPKPSPPSPNPVPATPSPPPRAAPPTPPLPMSKSPSNLSPKPSPPPPVIPTYSVPQSPKPKTSTPPSPMPTRLVSPPPPSKAAAVSPTTNNSNTRELTPSPETPKYNESKTPPPSPFTLPPSLLYSDHRQHDTNFPPPETEQKIVMVQDNILDKPKATLSKDNTYINHSSPNFSKKEKVKNQNNHNKKLSDSEDMGMRVITLAGENRGAIMELAPSQYPRNGQFATNNHHPKNGNHKKSSSDNDKFASDSEGKKNKGKNHSAVITPFRSYTNSNVQGVNNSILYNCSCTHNDPGVHLTLSTKPKDHSIHKHHV